MSPSFRNALATFLSLIILGLSPLPTLAESNLKRATPLRSMPLPPLNQPFPVINFAKSIQEAYANPEQWDGHGVSIEGKIKSAITNSRGQPIIELSLDENSGTAIRVMFAFPIKRQSFIRIGEPLRVMGWLRNASEWAKVVPESPTQYPLVLLSICLVKIPSLDAVFDSTYIEYCEEWEKGNMPL